MRLRTMLFAAARKTTTDRTLARRRGFPPAGIERLEGRDLLSLAADALPLARPLAVAASTAAEHSHAHLQSFAPATATAAPLAAEAPHNATPLGRRHHGVSGPPSAVGSWSPVIPFRPPHSRGIYLAIHTTLLPNGDIITWPHAYNYFLAERHAAPYTPDIMLWNPTTNQYLHMNLPTSNLFCSGSTFLPDGKLIVLGGHGPSAYPTGALQTAYGNNHVEIYNYVTNTWTQGPDMSHGRYYGSAITLGTGQALVLAGYNEDGVNNARIEVYTEGQGFRTLTGATTANYPNWYPALYQLNDGLVFGASPGRATFLLNPQGAGQIWGGPPLNYPRRYYGTSVMYAPNQILDIGGNAAPGRAAVGGNNLITNSAETINFNDPNPSWHYTGSMRYARFFPNATLLPDGTVLVTGGTRQQSNPSGNALAGAVYAGEIWNPATGQWTTMSSMKVPRLYHSTAILLPSGQVMVAGGGEPSVTGEARNATHQNMQIFSPPYLFRGPQPVISQAPSLAYYGQTITVSSPDTASIATVNLVRPGTVTHGVNFTQKLVPATFTQGPGDTLQIQMPTNPNEAPPGPYMIFLLNQQGVPSKAAMFFLEPPPASPASPAPAPSASSGPGSSGGGSSNGW